MASTKLKRLSSLIDTKSKATVATVELPPSYDEATLPQITEPNLPRPFDVSAHLKLLFAFHKLKESVFNNSTLFGIDDSWLPTEGPQCTEDVIKARHAIREKRWDIYVKRAALRFESWWKWMRDQSNGYKVTVKDLYLHRSSALEPDAVVDQEPWGVEKIPPLDVLMVWHSFLLSPRRYLEDCLSQGMMSLWHAKFPWSAIDQCIDPESGEYNPGDEAVSVFEKSCLPWSNVDDDCTIAITCVKCTHEIEAKCTAFSKSLKVLNDTWNCTDDSEVFRSVTMCAKVSRGWSDASFEVKCPKCFIRINRDVLCAQKLIKDVQAYGHKKPVTDGSELETMAKHESQILQSHIDPWSLSDLFPVPGTILSPDTGKRNPSTTKESTRILNAPQIFPIALVDTLSHVNSEGITGKPPVWSHSMRDIRKMIETTLGCEKQMLYATSGQQRRANRAQRVAVRRMMSYYNDNPSIFGLDLASAVMRQSNFVQKMQLIDWLHSPALSSTATRVIIKYQRFYQIMKPGQIAVPTLDIDLAWHTHQLTPQEYWRYTVEKKGRFIDHDDKISEHKLSDAFAKTSARYQELFNEPYSECTCWYCEAIHASVAKYPDRKWFRNGVKNGYRRPAHAPNDHTAAHISTHNVVKMQYTHSNYTTKLQEHLVWLDKAYRRACERAKKDGRPAPRRRHPQAVDAYSYYDSELGVGTLDGKSRAAMVAGVAGVAMLGVGALAIAYSDGGGLNFEGQYEEVPNGNTSAAGCIGGSCGGGVGWGGDDEDNGGTNGACGGDGGPCASWDAAAAAEADAGCGGGCSDCGGGCGCG